jgi:hypothetical protein
MPQASPPRAATGHEQSDGKRHRETHSYDCFGSVLRPPEPPGESRAPAGPRGTEDALKPSSGISFSNPEAASGSPPTASSACPICSLTGLFFWLKCITPPTVSHNAPMIIRKISISGVPWLPIRSLVHPGPNGVLLTISRVTAPGDARKMALLFRQNNSVGYPKMSELLRITPEEIHEHFAYLHRICRIVEAPPERRWTIRCTPPCFRVIERPSNALTPSRPLLSVSAHFPIAASIHRPSAYQIRSRTRKRSQTEAARDASEMRARHNRLFRLHSSPLALIGFGLVKRLHRVASQPKEKCYEEISTYS